MQSSINHIHLQRAVECKVNNSFALAN